MSGAKIILLQRLSILITDQRGIPTEIKGAILCKDLSPNMKYAAYIIFTGTPYERSLGITQWIYDSSSGHVTSMYSMDIMGQKWQTRRDGWREIKLGEFNTGVTRSSGAFCIFWYLQYISGKWSVLCRHWSKACMLNHGLD